MCRKCYSAHIADRVPDDLPDTLTLVGGIDRMGVDDSESGIDDLTLTYWLIACTKAEVNMIERST